MDLVIDGLHFVTNVLDFVAHVFHFDTYFLYFVADAFNFVAYFLNFTVYDFDAVMDTIFRTSAFAIRASSCVNRSRLLRASSRSVMPANFLKNFSVSPSVGILMTANRKLTCCSSF